jgi:hypothetical protein
MVLQSPDASSIGHPDYHGNMDLTLGAPAKACSMRFQLVKGKVTETRKLNFAYGPESINCHSDRHAHDGRLCQRSINRSLFAELIEESLCDPKDPSIESNIFPKNNHAVILLHLLAKG